jgi:NAD(P)-dependent dehydrogenase (short-subunit alcohol dehydrogenase family)
VARDRAKLEETAAECAKVGAESAIFVADVTDEAQVATLEKDVVARFGKVDILVNNAGVNVRKNLVDYTMEEWRKGHRHKSHVGVSVVSSVRAAHARARLRTHPQSHLDHESRFAARPRTVFGQQGRIARLDARAGAGARGREDYGGRRSAPGPFATR